MRTLAAFVASLLLTGTLSVGAPGVVAAQADPDIVPGSWIVQLRADRNPHRDAPALAARAGGSVGHIYGAALRGFSFSGSATAAAALARNPNVVAVEADRRVQATQVPTGIRRIDATDAAGNGNLTTSGAGVTVAILDTGVSPHPAFGSRLLGGTHCIGTSTADGNGHGTHVAGTVGGSGIGVAQGVSLVPVKVLDDSGSGTWASVICGIDYVTANAATIKVANMSLGGSSSENPTSCSSSTLHQAICNSVAAGVTYTVAAGNDARDASGSVPAKFPEVITVSAFSDLDGVRDPATNECVGFGRWKDCDEELARFSNYGSAIDVMAPGVRIRSSIPGGYDTYSGTSMAAPHVAGVAALAIAAGTANGPAALKAWLRQTGECPNATLASSGGTCSGTWRGDPDGIAEPMVHAARAIAGSGGPTVPSDTQAPDVSVTAPAAGATVSGVVSVQVSATDDVTSAGSLGVQVRIGGGSWQSATWNGTAHTLSWDTAATANGSTSIEARATDAAGHTGSATPVTVTVDNAPPVADGIQLTATGYKVKGAQHADLTWGGQTGTVDVWRDGTPILQGSSASSLTDVIGSKGGGSYTYQVCPTGIARGHASCSNQVVVSF